MKYRLVFLFATIFLTGKTFSQGWNADSAESLSTVDGIVHSLYDVISGPAGEERDWNTFRNLFADDAKMYIAAPDKDNGTVLKSITPEEYAERNKTLFIC